MKIKKSKIVLHFILLFCILTLAFCILPQGTEAAVLYLEPASGEYYQDDIFIVEVKLDTEGKEINAVKIDLVFSQDLLEVKDFSQGDSVLSFWPKKPTFSNREGIISFVGGVPGGFQGDRILGKVIFQIKKNEEQLSVQSAEVKFSDGSQALLNDGLGTPAHLFAKGAFFDILPERLEIPRDEWREMLKQDNNPPEPFEIILGQDPLLFDGQYFIVFSTTDKQTGIDYYEVKEGVGEWKRAESPYLLKDQGLKSAIKVKAVDKAGNEKVVEYRPAREFSLWWLLGIMAGIVLVWRLTKKFLISKS